MHRTPQNHPIRTPSGAYQDPMAATARTSLALTPGHVSDTLFTLYPASGKCGISGSRTISRPGDE